jgi:hypothetical protein
MMIIFVEDNSELRVESEWIVVTTCDIQTKPINSQTKYEVTQMNDLTLSPPPPKKSTGFWNNNIFCSLDVTEMDYRPVTS